ncbi:hypothetical protein RI129_002974 [Pyrocoelia pectoralis]|uniref:Cytochrome P450 n=1 Tax=Pyrocoelia pectoralis TaxID=417401 RepID=A0AAN7ZMN7_9COLE
MTADRHIARDGYKDENVIAMWNEALQQCDETVWANYVRHTEETVKQWYKREEMDITVDELIINVENCSERSDVDNISSQYSKLYFACSFLQLLIELSEDTLHLTKTEIREEVMTFFIAGSETTATTTAFTLLTLGIDLTVLGSNRNIVYQDLPKFVYLERVLKETLRLFPGGPLLGRSVTSDIKLRLYYSRWFFFDVSRPPHARNPEIYPDPLKFDPDRFLSEQVAKRHPYAWLPFSGGHRNCIGMKYAFMVMKTVIANIVREFKITTPYRDVGEIALESQLVLTTPGGYPISLQKRD